MTHVFKSSGPQARGDLVQKVGVIYLERNSSLTITIKKNKRQLYLELCRVWETAEGASCLTIDLDQCAAAELRRVFNQMERNHPWLRDAREQESVADYERGCGRIESIYGPSNRKLRSL